MKSFDKVLLIVASAVAGAAALIVGCGEQAQREHLMPPAQPEQAPTDGQSTPSKAAMQPAHLIRPPSDPRAALELALGAGLLADGASDNDKLRRVLRVAGVAEASQVLVFSKTSLQAELITPTHPRAIYFNDDCYIGYVPGGLIEYGDADADPAVGSGFFALDLQQRARATLAVDTDCMSCHSGSRTDYRPGFLVRSVFPDHEGFPITSAGSTVVGHDTPIEKRWGGWYVTGLSGKTHHRGNQTADELPSGDTDLDPARGSNITDLSPYFNTARYLQPTSDIVALMVLEHQVQMHNLLTQGSSVVHEQAERSRSLAKHLGEPFDPTAPGTLQRVIDSNAEKIVRHLLYADEVALAEPVAGGDAYQHAFRANRREDARGRSLKDFDLQTRMFRYRCSYMVYSRAFGLMPDLLKGAVITRLRAVLTGEHADAAYTHLGKSERRAISAILSETTDWY